MCRPTQNGVGAAADRRSHQGAETVRPGCIGPSEQRGCRRRGLGRRRRCAWDSALARFARTREARGRRVRPGPTCHRALQPRISCTTWTERLPHVAWYGRRDRARASTGSVALESSGSVRGVAGRRHAGRGIKSVGGAVRRRSTPPSAGLVCIQIGDKALKPKHLVSPLHVSPLPHGVTGSIAMR